MSGLKTIEMDISEVPGFSNSGCLEKLLRLRDVVERKTLKMDDSSLKMESEKHEMRTSSVSVARALPTFSGTTSPWEHAFRYYMTMSAAGATPMEIISLFPMTLSGPIKVWCLTLNNLSGYRWEVLAQAFIKKSEEMSREVSVALKSPEPESLPKPLAWGTGKKVVVIDLTGEESDSSRQDAPCEGSLKNGKGQASQAKKSRRDEGGPSYGGVGGSNSRAIVKASNVRRAKRNFADLRKPIEKVYEYLVGKKVLTPLNAKPPNTLKLDRTRFCPYHGYHGHNLDQCMRLRHEIQDRIDDGMIPDPSKRAKKA